MMTRAEAMQALSDIWQAGLYGRDFVHRFSIEQFIAACNGIGPESWPEKRRAKLDRWLATFRRAADVHDCRYTYDNDGTREKFDYANGEIERNCLILANQKYAWYNPMRYFARHAAHLIGKACRDFGWDAFDDAFRKTHNARAVAGGERSEEHKQETMQCAEQ